MIHEPRFLAGLDLGKRQDYTALAILEHRRRVSGWDPVYFCQKIDWDLCVRRLVRFPLGTSYRDLVDLEVMRSDLNSRPMMWCRVSITTDGDPRVLTNYLSPDLLEVPS